MPSDSTKRLKVYLPCLGHSSVSHLPINAMASPSRLRAFKYIRYNSDTLRPRSSQQIPTAQLGTPGFPRISALNGTIDLIAGEADPDSDAADRLIYTVHSLEEQKKTSKSWNAR